jgi:hypothetical protein
VQQEQAKRDEKERMLLRFAQKAELLFNAPEMRRQILLHFKEF